MEDLICKQRTTWKEWNEMFRVGVVNLQVGLRVTRPVTKVLVPHVEEPAVEQRYLEHGRGYVCLLVGSVLGITP